MTSNSVLITGGAGFIGSHVAEEYLSRGYSVTVLDDLSSGRRENVPRGVELVVADVGSETAADLVRDSQFATINHHAAQMDVRVSVADPMLDAQVNLLGLLNLLQAARDGGVAKFVFASSGGVVYGESDDLPHTETAPKLPVSPYGVSKLSSEYYLAAFKVLHGIECVSLRYANVYGPRQNPHGEAGVVAIFGDRIRRGESLRIFGDGSQTRDYVYVRDVARMNVAATEFDCGSADTIDALAINVGTGIETSVTELARAMITASGSDAEIVHAAARPGELQRSAVAIGRAKRLLGWEPEVQLSDGLSMTYNWIVEAAA